MNIFNKFKVNNEDYQLDWENGIGNKPFGTEEVLVDVFPSQELTFTEIVEGKYGTVVESDSIVIKEGRTYTVTFDNDVYECIGAAIATLDMQFIALGNLSLNETGEDTGEPFTIGYATGGLEIITNSSGSHTMKIQTAEKTIKQLDSKYIKDMYGEVNKVEEILPLQTVEFKNEGTDTYNFESPLEIDCEIKVGDYMKVMYDGVEYNCEIVDFAPLAGVGWPVPAFGNVAAAFGEGDTGEPFLAMIDTTGSLSSGIPCFLVQDLTEVQEGVETITREVGIKYNVNEISYINPKFIKDMYGIETIKEEYMPLQDVTFTPHIDQDTNEVQGWSEIGYSLVGTYEDVNVGDKIFVLWDGVEYECVVISFQGLNCIGNVHLMTGTGDNRMPFIIALDITGGIIADEPTILLINCYDENPTDESATITHSVSVSMAKEITNQIKPKYIKDMYYSDGYEYTPVLEEASYDFVYDEEESTYYSNLPVIEVDLDKTYRITVDGASIVTNWNIAGERDGVPYMFMITFGIYMIAVNTENAKTVVLAPVDTEPKSHTISIEIQGEEIVHHIPIKYIKDMYGIEGGEQLFSQDVTTVADPGGFNLNENLENLGLKLGKTYKIIFEGVEYVRTAQGSGQGISLGNMRLADNSGTDTGEPFGFVGFPSMGIYGFGTKEPGTFHVEIYEEEIIKHIPSKYIKDMHRSEGMEEVTFIPGEELTFTLDSQYGAMGFYSSYNYAYQGRYRKLEDKKTYKVTWGNETYESKAFKVEVDGQKVVAVGNAALFQAGENTGEPFIIGSFFNDVWAERSIMGYFTLDTTPSRYIEIKEFKEKIVNPIEGKFIENMYHSDVIDTEEILSESDFIFQKTDSTDHPDFKYYNTELVLALEEGVTYRVTFDGVDYDCVCKVYRRGGNILNDSIYLGNYALSSTALYLGSHEYNYEIPFCICMPVSEGAKAQITCANGLSHKIKIVKLYETVHQVPSKFVNAYTKEEIDTMFGTYVDEVDTLLGGE